MLTGENGILNQAQNASTETEKASIIEQAKTDIIDRQIENQNGSITKADLKEILGKYFDLDSNTEIPDDLTTLTLTTKEEYGSYAIKISDIYNGTFAEEKEYINTETSCVGDYYADIDGNGSVDGVIYADLAKDVSGQWPDGDEWGPYSYTAESNTLKNYYVSQTGYEGLFGTKDVLKAEGNGADRFYVMALNDVDSNTHYWYYNASGLENIVSESSNDFGAGKTNTSTMISKWNNGGYGTQDNNDMWKVIQIKVGNINDPTWFVPSKSEWAAFGDALDITTDNYPNYGLKDRYWSSSQYGTSYAFGARFDTGYIGSSGVGSDGYVRLSATF